MSPEFNLNMCESHLRNEQYYECIQDNDPSPLLKNRIIAYAIYPLDLSFRFILEILQIILSGTILDFLMKFFTHG